VEDFEEILEYLSNAYDINEEFKPKKIQRIIASKACHSSVRVG
jgi:hypothetical protein